MSTDSTLYEETFEIRTVLDQTYDRVARILATTASADTSLTLDINNELYPLQVGEHVQMVIATTLNLDGTKEDVSKGWREKTQEENSLADMFDYVCWGKVYAGCGSYPQAS